MRRDVVFLAVSVLWISVTFFCLALTVSPYLRTLLALPLVMVLPGTALLNALRIEFPAPGRYAIIVGLSMALTVLSGLLLGLGNWLTPYGWLSWLGLITLGGAILGCRPGAVTSVLWTLPRLRARHVVLCGTLLGVMVLTVQNATRHSNAYLPFPYTNFWMLPTGQPSNVYTIGIKNGERADQQFTVRVMVDRVIVGVWQVEVPVDQTVVRTMMLPEGHKAVAWLLRGTGPEVYRKVSAALRDTTLAASD